ncbi:MAG: T9SS type A sorting domain-containing protein [Bacteroidetes bacterium]|nr:MAG: T9SS type A sorting domain-containing protein [Bacteroidota bacterium]
MNKLYVFIILCITVESAKADWDLFPLNQKSYYRYTDYHDNIEQINLIAIDTIVQRSGFQSAFMNRKYSGNGLEQCYEAVTDVNNFVAGYGWMDTEIDSLIYSGDTVRYSSKLYFLPKVSVGESWRISGALYNGVTDVEFTCTSLTLQSFLGITDSVKEFTLSTYDGTTLVNSSLSAYVIKLSKNYGLLDYPSFYLLEHHFKESHLLTGLSDSTGTYGFQPPTYLDFFPYKAGDVLNWKFQDLPPWSPSTTLYSHELILSVLITADTLKYTSYRQGYNPGNGYYSSDTAEIAYAVEYFKGITECPSNWLVLSSQANLANSDISFSTSYVLEQDSSISYRINQEGHYVDTNMCQLGQYIDVGQHFIYNTKQGFTEYCNDAFHYNCTKLIGSYMDGVLYGDTNFVTGIEQVSLENLLDISPNPAINKLCISLLTRSAQKAKIEITNLSGSIVYSDIAELSESTCSKEINIAQFANGFYFITVSDPVSKKVGRKKFVVQH